MRTGRTPVNVRQGCANLDAPADPGAAVSRPARVVLPLLVQLLKNISEGEKEIIGTVIIPNGVLVLLALLPLLGIGQLAGSLATSSARSGRRGNFGAGWDIDRQLCPAPADRAAYHDAQLFRTAAGRKPNTWRAGVNLAHAGVPADGRRPVCCIAIPRLRGLFCFAIIVRPATASAQSFPTPRPRLVISMASPPSPGSMAFYSIGAVTPTPQEPHQAHDNGRSS